MKSIYIFAALIFLFSAKGFSQDTTHYKVLRKVNVQKNTKSTINPTNEVHLQNHVMYRDTRLGSSSPLYNTYKKNDYGAGAVTTNPNKSAGPSFINEPPVIKSDSLKHVSDSTPHQ